MYFFETYPPSGRFSLDRDTIERSVNLPLPGAYVLRADGWFPRFYVGRSDSDVRDRLKRQAYERGKSRSGNGGIADFLAPRFNEFVFWYALSPAMAHKLECELYHYLLESPRFGILDNLVHPDSPAGCSVPCPICGLPANPFTRALDNWESVLNSLKR